MTHPLTPREKVARAIQAHDNDHVPDGYANGLSDEVSDWSAYLADRVLTALASGSGDHAELARLAEEALLPIPEKRRKSWFNRQNRFRDAANPATVLALLAENAALRAKAGLADMLGEKLERRTFALDEAERKLAEAVGLLREAASEIESEVEARYDGVKDHPAMTPKYERDMDTPKRINAFLSKEAERG